MSKVAITLHRDEPTGISAIKQENVETPSTFRLNQRGTHHEDCALVCFAPLHTPYKFGSSKTDVQHASIGQVALIKARLSGARRLHSLAHLHNISYKDC